MNYQINKEEIEKVEKLEGEVRGAVFKTDEKFIRENFGESGIEKVESELKKMGHPFSYREAKKMDFYPVKMRIFSLFAVSSAFQMGKEDIKQMGEKAPRASFLIKVFTKHFMSIETTLEKVGEIWEKHYTIGKVEPVEVREDKKHAIFNLYKGNFHPIFCDYLSGYFESIVGMVVGAQAEAEERKCIFRGDEKHEFYIKWE